MHPSNSMLLQSHAPFYLRRGSGTIQQLTVPDAPSGNLSYQITSQGPATMATQPIPISPDSNYLIECYVRNQSPDHVPRGVFMLGVEVQDWQNNSVTKEGRKFCWEYFFQVAGKELRPGWTKLQGRIGRGQQVGFPGEGRFMAVGVVVNYGDGNAQSAYEVSCCRVMEIE